MRMAENSIKGLKKTVGKEKLLVTSNFSFSHSVFKRPILQTRKNQGLLGKVFTVFQRIEFVFNSGENIVGKGLPGFSHFPTMFSKGFLLRTARSRHSMVKVKWHYKSL